MERDQVNIMEQFEKVEKLSQKANVSYEEAKEALEKNNWDMLDAIVYLEQLGKAEAPNNSSYSTSYEEQPQYLSVPDTIKSQDTSGHDGASKLKRLIRKLMKKSKENYFYVTRKGEEVVKMPVWAFVLILLFMWEFTLAVMVIALFFGCRYSFVGKDDLSGINDVMDKAGNFADKVKEEYDKL